MFVRILYGRQSIAGPGGVTWIHANTGVYWASSLGGGGYVYSRPVAVSPPGSDAMISIRDHVMIMRLASILVLALAAFWRLTDGR
jgi:hypothetical protein